MPIKVFTDNGEQREFDEPVAAISYIAVLSGRNSNSIRWSIARQRDRNGPCEIRGSASRITVVDPDHQIRPPGASSFVEKLPPHPTDEEKWVALAKKLRRRGLLD